MRRPPLSGKTITADEKALAEDNLGLAFYFAGKARHGILSYGEVLSAAVIGLYRAARTFNPELGDFGAHAWRHFRSQSQEDAKLAREIVHVPFRHPERAFHRITGVVDLTADPVPVDMGDTAVLRRALTPRQRDLVTRLYDLGERQEDVAREWGTTSQNVSSSHRKALARRLPVA